MYQDLNGEDKTDNCYSRMLQILVTFTNLTSS